MALVDWRALYAANRAVIEGARGAPRDLPAGPLGKGRAPSPTRAPAPAHPRGAWDEVRTTARGRTGRAFVHRPPGLDPGAPAPLICMLHGCTQDAVSFAAATRMNEAAARHGFVVVYPEQGRADNAQGCWNWFRRGDQARDAGEPAWIAAVVTEVMSAGPAPIDSRRVFAAGLSAGGAMAAILGVTHPDLFAAVAVHSGLAYASAASVPGAFGAMARGGGGGAGRAAHTAMGARARRVPGIVIHGTADRTVAPVNAERVLEQWTMADRLAGAAPGGLDPARPASVVRGRVDRGHGYTRSRWTDAAGAVTHEMIRVEGMGHAWSGGTPGGSYTDPRGPDATEAICGFFAEVTGGARSAGQARHAA